MPRTKSVSAGEGRSLNSFRARHDKDTVIPNKIRAAFAAMAKLGPEWHEYEAEFAKLAKIGQADLSKYRELFKDHIIEIRYCDGKALGASKNVWFHDRKVAAKLRATTASE